jgi:hypothetical protein
MEEINELFDKRSINLEAPIMLKWFIEHVIDNYLDQNTHTVLKALNNDNPPLEIKEFLLIHEIHHKNRKEVLEALQ